MRKTFLKLSFTVLVLLVVSCKKSSSSKSKTELLTQKAWITSNVEIPKEGNWQTDPDFTNSKACVKDNPIIFKANKMFEVIEGASKCSELDPPVNSEGVWNLEDNETKLTIFGQTGTIEKLG